MIQMAAEGVDFRAGAIVDGDELRRDFDAVVLTMGARSPRDLPIPGRDLGGVHFAMEFLVQQNRRVAGEDVAASTAILATGKRVAVGSVAEIRRSHCVGTLAAPGRGERHAARAHGAQADSGAAAGQPVARSGRSSSGRRRRTKRARRVH